MARKAATPHDEEIGFVTSRANSLTRGHVVLYDGDEAGLDTSGGRWSVFCPEHGSLISETSKARATKMLRSPHDWCRQCRKIARSAQEPASHPMRRVTEKSPEDIEREMRFWAKKAKNNPEKQALFEKMYGVSPEPYWGD